MPVEMRGHLGPGEIEIDTPLYGVLLVSDTGGKPMMTNQVFTDKEKAKASLPKWQGAGFVVTIKGTNA